MKNLKKILKVFSVILVSIILVISVLTLLSVLGIPKSAQIFVVETGSMEPEIPQGSMVFVSQQDSYQVGDIITYKSNLGEIAPKNINVTHRIADIKNDNGDTFYETKGDANTGKDPWTANKLDVLGKVTFHIPYVGYIIGFAKTKLGFIFIILIPALLIIFLEMLNISKILKDKRQERNYKEESIHLNL